MKFFEIVLCVVAFLLVINTTVATVSYFGHLSTNIAVDVGSDEVKTLQRLIDTNQFSAPVEYGCGQNQCLSFYKTTSGTFGEDCTQILHFDKDGNELDAVRTTKPSSWPSGLNESEQTEFNYSTVDESLASVG